METPNKRDLVFQQFCYHPELRFSELERSTGLRSNDLAYVLKMMVQEGTLDKTTDGYRLSGQAEKNIPFFKERGKDTPLPVILIAIHRKREEGTQEVLLARRKKRPYKGLWSLPGGRILLGETIEDATRRIAKEKTFMDINSIQVKGLGNERVMDNEVKHGFLLVFVACEAVSDITEKPDLYWCSPDDLPEDMIASDAWFAKRTEGFVFKEFIEKPTEQ